MMNSSQGQNGRSTKILDGVRGPLNPGNKSKDYQNIEVSLITYYKYGTNLKKVQNFIISTCKNCNKIFQCDSITISHRDIYKNFNWREFLSFNISIRKIYINRNDH